MIMMFAVVIQSRGGVQESGQVYTKIKLSSKDDGRKPTVRETKSTRQGSQDKRRRKTR